MIGRGWRLERIHDLQKLCDHLASFDGSLASRLQPLVDDLAESYTESRYPGFDLEPSDWPHFDRLLIEVKRYVAQARRRLKKRTQ